VATEIDRKHWCGDIRKACSITCTAIGALCLTDARVVDAVGCIMMENGITHKAFSADLCA
jgi:hypothetical protein